MTPPTIGINNLIIASIITGKPFEGIAIAALINTKRALKSILVSMSFNLNRLKRRC